MQTPRWLQRAARAVLGWDRDNETRHRGPITVAGFDVPPERGDLLMLVWSAPLDRDPGPGWVIAQPGIAYRVADGTEGPHSDPDSTRLVVRGVDLTRPLDLPPTIPMVWRPDR